MKQGQTNGFIARGFFSYTRKRCTFVVFLTVLLFLYLTGISIQFQWPLRFLMDSPKLTEEEIFRPSFPLEENDPRLTEYVREKYLIPPPSRSEPYNLENPTGDPSANEGQNQYVLKILNSMRDGFFVECGAWDGERLSTTLVLERDYGWNGFLAEPNLESFAKLRIKKRKAWIANICLSTINHPQKVNFGEVHSGGFLPAHSAIREFLAVQKDVAITNATCFPIFTVLSALEVTVVDFFTLDIEGAELTVLKTIPFDKILIKIFCVEWNHIPEGKEELAKFMVSKGYKVVADIQKATASDYIFVHHSVPLPATL